MRRFRMRLRVKLLQTIRFLLVKTLHLYYHFRETVFPTGLCLLFLLLLLLLLLLLVDWYSLV